MSEPIKLGAVLPFSGPPALRINGPRMQAGTAAWISLYNERGGWRGRRLELIVEDSAYDIDVTAKALRKLAEQDKVLALLNANGTPQLTAAMDYLQARRLPVFLPFAGDETWYDPPRWGVYGLQAPFVPSGYLLGRWAATAGHQRVVVFYPDYPEVSVLMADESCRGFQEHAASGQAVFKVRVPLGSQDGEAMAAAIAEHEPDAIIVLVNWVELYAALSVLRKRGASPALYSWSANVTQQIASLGEDLLEGAYGYSALIVSPTSDAPEVQEYRRAMERLFPDQEPDFLSMTAFAHAKVFTAALDGVAGELGVDSLVSAFDALRSCRTGLLPEVSFSELKHLGARDVQPMQLVGGVWRSCGEPARLPGL